MSKSGKIIIAGLAVILCGALATKYDRQHPDSVELLEKEKSYYAPLIDSATGKVKDGWYSHRTENGLSINLQKKNGIYVPQLGVYINSDKAKVHVENIGGIIKAHTHAMIPNYSLGRHTLHGMQLEAIQMAPDHYDKGPSNFIIKFSKPCRKGEMSCTIEGSDNYKCKAVKIHIANGRNRTARFELSFPSYPRDAVFVVTMDMNGNKQIARYALHKLPPREILNRQIVK